MGQPDGRIDSLYCDQEELAMIRPEFRSVPHYRAVQTFLHFIDELEPKVADDLLELEESYLSAPDVIRNSDPSTTGLWDLISDFSPEDQDLAALREGIRGWAERWHLENGQGLYEDIGLRALKFYIDFRDFPSEDEPLKIQLQHGIRPAYRNPLAVRPIDKALPFIFTPSRGHMKRPRRAVGHWSGEYIEWEWDDAARYESLFRSPHPDWSGIAWDPETETWGQFRSKVKAAFENYMDLYKASVEQRMDELGFVQATEKINMEHFKWLVEFQVIGTSKGKIAKQNKKTEKAIRDGINTAAELVLLSKLRPTEVGGRPPEDKDATRSRRKSTRIDA